MFASMTAPANKTMGAPANTQSHRVTSLFGGETAQAQERSAAKSPVKYRFTRLDGGDSATAEFAQEKTASHSAPATSLNGGQTGAATYEKELIKVRASAGERKAREDGSTCPWDTSYGGSRAEKQPTQKEAQAAADALWFAQHRTPAAPLVGPGSIPRTTALW